MPNFQVTVRDIEQRKQEIREKIQQPLRTEMFYEYHSGGDDLPVIDLDIHTPVYRMSNYRTTTYQRSYVRNHNKPSDFFSSGEEDVEAQRAQHTILIDLSKQGSGTTIKPIMDVLTESQRQTQSLLITREGVVVNGNRRLAAMRELYQSDPSRYQDFEQVQAMVLPPVTLDDIRRIEVRLQMTPETRLPYDWINEGLAVRDLREHGHSRTEIKSLMQLSRDREVDAIITRLQEAETYLEEYLGRPEDYVMVGDKQQLFIELQKALDAKNDSVSKELARHLCHVVTKHSRDLDTRAYHYKIAFGSQTEAVANRLAEQWGIDLPDLDPASDTDDDDDVFGETESGTSQKDYSELMSRLSDETNSGQNADAIKQVCDDLREQENEENRGQRALKRVRQAFQALDSVDFDQADPTSFDEIQSLLEQISDLAGELIVQLNSENA